MHLQDLEQGTAEQSEKSVLLPDRRTSSFDEDLKTSVSRAQSRSLPHSSKQALDVSAAPEAGTSDYNDEEQSTESNKMKGLGLAGIATMFQAVMSVCAKILGQYTHLLMLVNTQAHLQHLYAPRKPVCLLSWCLFVFCHDASVCALNAHWLS